MTMATKLKFILIGFCIIGVMVSVYVVKLVLPLLVTLLGLYFTYRVYSFFQRRKKVKQKRGGK